MNSTSNIYKSSVNYSCAEGASLSNGAPSIVTKCEIQGEWYPPLVTCIGRFKSLN